MNSLNSVLLEGFLIGDPIEGRTEQDEMECTFNISSERYYKKDEEIVKEMTTVSVKVYSILADSCARHLQKGRGVRVVGRLKQVFDEDESKTSQVLIQAEHVEFKPIVVAG
ncbi:single-stranded DNA-binding protein [Thiospirochaeta perfilievii]|uniref:Single-stranded DNA-binding protein n=1 Tax=Thiospirochaeta perfilievii TaxID=252967 RepID=A0A5C1Q5L2_9SPIO|nr:single-stranded DNA-binding protein [Thiospirochaeta perfilievii]QEN03343.1 single-stranded DNA-binding protein [Thiospirochaeta perfilievii]